MTHRDEAGFLQIEDYGLIGDMHTCALVGKDASLDYLCWPKFDSPTIFCRMLDGNGGHWSIEPSFGKENTTSASPPISKQQYTASSNVLLTRWIHERAVVSVLDFFALSKTGDQINKKNRPAGTESSPILVRKVECLRGEADVNVEIIPRPDYARGDFNFHSTGVRQVDETTFFQSAQFDEDGLPGVHVVYDGTLGQPEVFIDKKSGVEAHLHLVEGQEVYFVLAMGDEKSSEQRQGESEPKPNGLIANGEAVPISQRAFDLAKTASELELQTKKYWQWWVRKCSYRGRFQQQVERSMLLLKLLTYKPSGAIVAAPTFSLPEAIGGSRNWDYRYSWVRDSSFTVYVFLKMGFVDEAEAYINFIFDRIEDWHQAGASKPLPLMFSITGDTDLPEYTLDHLGGYKDTKPVRVGNAATGHIQLDIYGELMDAIYLYNKHGKPVTYDQWLSIRHLICYVSTVW